MRVLICSDDAGLAASLRRVLEAERYVVTIALSGDGLEFALDPSFDVAILDAAEPTARRLEVLRAMRAQCVWTRVVVLTTTQDETAQVEALNLGADDLLTTPFSFEVFVARMRALLRRGANERPVVLVAGSLSLDSIRRQVKRGRASIHLTPREFGLLEYLMRHRDIVVSRADIRENVWEPRFHDAANVVEVYIGHVRRKIDAPFGTNTIQTIRGVGYRLDSGEYAVDREDA